EIEALADGSRLPLRLDDAIALALARQLDVGLGRLDWLEAVQGVVQAESQYDLELIAEAEASSERSLSSDSLAGSDISVDEAQNLVLRLSTLLPTGGRVQLSLPNDREVTNSRFASFNPGYRSNLTLTLTQPLLRGFGRRATERPLRLARARVALSLRDFETQVIEVLREVESQYWSLVAERAQRDVAEQALRLAEELHEQNRIRVDVGTLASFELLESEAGIATRQEELLSERASVRDAQDRLMSALGLRDLDLWNLEVVPETRPEVEFAEIDLRRAVTSALAQRPEMRRQRREILDQADEVEFRRQALRPQLDLEVGYGLSGRGGDFIDRDFLTGEILETRPGGYQDALDQLAGGQFSSWRAGLTLTLPLQNRAAKAEASRARLEASRRGMRLRALEIEIIREVRENARALETSREAILTARASVALEEKALDAEKLRHLSGLSTSFRVLEQQEDLTAARNREVTAVTNYRRALMEFERSAGRLLTRHRIEITEDAAASKSASIGAADAAEPDSSVSARAYFGPIGR
ncbi:MAG: TolC family protein, partial [Acidobacteriota bacterium]